jgi:hypothetical protein
MKILSVEIVDEDEEDEEDEEEEEGRWTVEFGNR